MEVDKIHYFVKKVCQRASNCVKTALFVLLLLAGFVSVGQVGDYDINLHARDTLETDQVFMVAADTLIPITEVSFHQWSSDGITFHRHYVLGDRYLRISNDVQNTWVIVDLYDRYWVLGNDSAIYVNTDYANRILVDTTAAPSNFTIFTTGDMGADYYFLGEDSLTLTNIYNGGTTDGYILVASGDTAIFVPAPSGVGETNIMANVGTRGVGVYDNKNDTLFEMRNVASLTSMLTVTLNAPDSVIDLDLVLNSITAGVALSGGGSMENNITLNVYIPELVEMPAAVDSSADWLIIYDNSTATHYKIHPEDLLSVLGLYTAGDGLSLSGNVFSLDTPATVSDTSTNRVGTDDHAHELIIYDLTSVEDVTNSPVSGQYLKWNGTSWVTDSPSSGTPTYVDLYVDSVLQESQIDKLNVVAGTNVTATYLGDGGVQIDASGGSGVSVDLFTNDIFRESAIDTLNIVEGTGINVTYDVDGKVTIATETATARLANNWTLSTSTYTIDGGQYVTLSGVNYFFRIFETSGYHQTDGWYYVRASVTYRTSPSPAFYMEILESTNPAITVTDASTATNGRITITFSTGDRTRWYQDVRNIY